MTEVQTSSQRPYLLRAMHEWMTDNGLTAHIVVDSEAEGLRVPEGHARDGKIVLNVSFAATKDLSLGNELVCFEARFSGVPRQVTVPVDAILGIYARETGQGMVFTAEEPSPPEPDDDKESRRQKPSLRVVK